MDTNPLELIVLPNSLDLSIFGSSEGDNFIRRNDGKNGTKDLSSRVFSDIYRTSYGKIPVFAVLQANTAENHPMQEGNRPAYLASAIFTEPREKGYWQRTGKLSEYDSNLPPDAAALRMQVISALETAYSHLLYHPSDVPFNPIAFCRRIDELVIRHFADDIIVKDGQPLGPVGKVKYFTS